MTIKTFLNDLQTTGNKEFSEKMQDTVSIWDNNACKGYCIAAMHTGPDLRRSGKADSGI